MSPALNYDEKYCCQICGQEILIGSLPLTHIIEKHPHTLACILINVLGKDLAKEVDDCFEIKKKEILK